MPRSRFKFLSASREGEMMVVLLKLRLQFYKLFTFLPFNRRLSIALDRALVAAERIEGRRG